MTEQIKTGGSAFPRQNAVADANDPAFKLGSEGMTLRDYFAAKAMQSLIVTTELPEDFVMEELGRTTAEVAYIYADKMLAAREKQS